MRRPDYLEDSSVDSIRLEDRSLEEPYQEGTCLAGTFPVHRFPESMFPVGTRPVDMFPEDTCRSDNPSGTHCRCNLGNKDPYNSQFRKVGSLGRNQPKEPTLLGLLKSSVSLHPLTLLRRKADASTEPA